MSIRHIKEVNVANLSFLATKALVIVCGLNSLEENILGTKTLWFATTSTKWSVSGKHIVREKCVKN